MKWKRKMPTTLAILLASTIAGCSDLSEKPDVKQAEQSVAKTGFPIVKDTITVKAFSRQDPQHGEYADMYLWKAMEEKTNIHMEWDTPNVSAARERLNLLFSTNELPEIILKNNLTLDQILKYASEGQIVALDKYIDEYAPNFKTLLEKDPVIKQFVTAPDGHIYFFPSGRDYLPSNVDRYPLMNTKWLEKLGLKSPKTTEELLQVLTAFRDKDPDGNGKQDQIPMSAHNLESLIKSVGGIFGLDYQFAASGFGANIEDGKVDIWLDSSRLKETLQFIKQMYDEKLIDQEIFSQTDQLFFGKLADGKIGFTSLYQPRNAGAYANDFDAIVPIKGPHGDQLWSFLNNKVTGAGLLITNKNQNIEASIRWADSFFTEEVQNLVYLGKEGETYDKNSDGTLSLRSEILNSANGMERELGSKWNYYPGNGSLGIAYEKQLAPLMQGTAMTTYIDKVKPYLPEKRLTMPMLSTEVSVRKNAILSDLESYVSEAKAKFILGTMSFDKWDEYVKQLERIGLPELEEIYQNEYDKMNKKEK